MITPNFLPANLLARRQADRLVRVISEEGSLFRGVLLGKRQQGKTDLLRQVHGQLFEKPEGPIPFFYAFRHGPEEGALARHFLATFCQQVRAFLMRQEELLWEPVAHLERELERPGLPLSLTELARDFLALPPACQLEYVSALPAQFVHREGRPVCLLLDETHRLSPESPFFSSLHTANLCWLLSGRLPFLLQVAGADAWPLLELESFSVEEALTLAERKCRLAGVHFSKQTWVQWCDLAGTSAWLIGLLVQSAATEGQPLNDVEQLGRVYARELVSGTLGNWLHGRWQRAIPDRRERARLAEALTSLSKGVLAPTASVPPESWDGLVAEEWAEETPTGPQLVLDGVQQDWLSQVTPPPGTSRDRLQSRALQSFLLRSALAHQTRREEGPWAQIRSRLLELSQTGLPEVWEGEGSPIFPLRLCSISVESEDNAELFWCYGFHQDRRGSQEASCVLLIALCREAPTTSQIESWSRQLENEARLLPATSRSGGDPAGGLGSRQQLWVVVPSSASQAGVASERRFSWEALSRLLGTEAPPGEPDKSTSFQQSQLSVPIAPRCEVAAVEMLEQIAERQGLAVDATDALRLALTEACRNAVQHSGNQGGKLLIDFWISSAKATLNIFNEGVPFGSQQEEALPADARGTGLRMIRSLMDAVILQAEPSGTRLIITKKFPSGIPAR